MNREDRRKLYKRLKPTINRIVALEKNIKAGINKEESEAEMNEIINSLSMTEMFAIEDYIYNKHLLENK